MNTTTGLQQTPLHDWHAAHGGRLVDFGGWSMPVQYASIVEEHQATRSAVGLFDISHMGRLIVEGEARLQFLDSLLTRRVEDMQPGQIRYSLICNESGGILDDVLAYRIAEAQSEPAELMLVVNASNGEKIVAWLEEHCDGQASIRDATHQRAMLAVQGPQAIGLMGQLFDCDLTAMRYYTGRRAELEGESCYVSRTGYTGEDGCEIICDASVTVAIWDRLATAAEKIGGMAAGLGARDTLRLEAAMPLYGHELSEAINPIQAGLGFAINLRDREFPGRDAITRFRQDGRQPVRIGLQLPGRRVPRQGCPVLDAGQQVGQVTSGTFSPTLEQPIAMAYVNSTAAEQKNLDIDIRGQLTPATVTPLPFYKRDR